MSFTGVLGKPRRVCVDGALRSVFSQCSEAMRTTYPTKLLPKENWYCTGYYSIPYSFADSAQPCISAVLAKCLEPGHPLPV